MRALRIPPCLVLLLAPALAVQDPGAPAAPAPEQRAAGEPRAWEHETSDVPVDPRVHFGALESGLRYAWATNPEPRERSYLRLHVAVGSLAEQEAERGMAHFLEHMAFNGSRNFPAGTLIEWFQEHGMAFGPDTNASTGFDATIYMLDLPESDEESLREGLTVLRDYADGLLLGEEEVQKEKGVIDGEERERDSPGYRVFVRQLDETLAGTRYPSRIPIGTKDARDAFTAESVGAFYRRWYRPENMTLVLVGDLGERDPTALVEEVFGDWSGPDTPVEPTPEPGAAERLDFAYAIHEPEIPTVTVVVERLEPWEEEPFTAERWTRELPLVFARSMLNLRFAELAKEDATPYLSAGVGDASRLRVFDGEALRVVADPERWEEALAFAERELRRALQFGFQQAELDEVRADSLRALDEAVEREATASSRALVGALLAASDARFVPTDARTRRELTAPAVEELTVEGCHEALREAWSEGTLSLHAVGAVDLGDEPGRRLREAWSASSEVEVAAGDEIAVAEFAYASDPERAGEIVSRRHVEDLDAHLVEFANGVTLTVKRTDFKERQVLLLASLGEGRLTVPHEASALVLVGDNVFDAGGLEAHDQDELRRLTAGRVVGLGFSVGEDSFVLSGSTTAEDLLFECELACAKLTAPGWRRDGLVRFRRALPQFYEGRKHQHATPLTDEFFPEVYRGDPRFGTPAQEALAAVEMDEVRAWLAPQLAEGPLEVTLVGDLDVDEAVRIAARTFGALPPRRAPERHDERRGFPEAELGVRQRHAIDTQIPKTLVFLHFPTTDGIDPRRRMRLGFLGEVVRDRLRVAVREELGASYSPGASAESSAVHPGHGMLVVQAMADPEGADELVEACLEVARALAEEGVDADEVKRLREPYAARLRDARRQNGFWVQALDEAHRRPASLDELRRVEEELASITAEEISALAAEYLDPARASVLVVAPEGP